MTDQDLLRDSLLETFVEYVKRALDIVQLKAEAIDDIASDPNAFTMGLAIVGVAGVAVAIGSWSFFGLIAYPIFAIILAVVGAGVLHLLATQVFKVRGDFITFFRPYSHAWIVYWPMVVPLLNFLVAFAGGLWLLVVTTLILERVYGLERPRAIAVVAIPTLAFMAIVVIFGTFFALWMFVLFGLRAAS